MSDDIKSAVTPDEYDELWSTPEEALVGELERLWGDLERALHGAINGRWSIECATKCWRIAQLTKVVGHPTPPEKISYVLLANGWYAELHEAIGIEAPISEETMAWVQEKREQGWV